MICIMLYPIVSPLQLFVSTIPAGQEACQLFIADHAKLIKLEAHGGVQWCECCFIKPITIH